MKLLSSELRLQQFSEMNLAPPLMAALEKLGVATPTPVQIQALPVALSGADLIAVAQTGSGKTLAFALPILAAFRKDPLGRALVLVPSREMALQTQRVFESLWGDTPYTCVVAIGGVPDNKQNSQLKKNPRLVIATPGRLNDLLSDNKLLLQRTSIIVIDEADRMLDLGFAPQLKSIKSTLRGTWQTLLFSASFSRDVETVAGIFMREEVVMIRAALAEQPVSKLKQTVVLLTEAMKKDRLLEDLKGQSGNVIVFAGSQESCLNVGSHLKQNGVSSDLIHGELAQGHRSRVIRDFRDGKFRVLVTTDLLARGLDFPSVELVINYDLPFQPEDFLHRIGRTARAGRSGTALTYLTPTDNKKKALIAPYLEGAREIQPDSRINFAKHRPSDKPRK